MQVNIFIALSVLEADRMLWLSSYLDMYLSSLAESAKLEEAEEEGDEDLEPWQGDDGEWDKEIDDDDEGDDEADTQKLAKLAAQVHILTNRQY